MPHRLRQVLFARWTREPMRCSFHHQREIDHETGVAHGMAGNVETSSMNANKELRLLANCIHLTTYSAVRHWTITADFQSFIAFQICLVSSYPFPPLW